MRLITSMFWARFMLIFASWVTKFSYKKERAALSLRVDENDS